jgi:hypothetical protein
LRVPKTLADAVKVGLHGRRRKVDLGKFAG